LKLNHVVSDRRTIAVTQDAAVATKRTTVILSNPSDLGRLFGTPGYKPSVYNDVIMMENRNANETIVA